MPKVRETPSSRSLRMSSAIELRSYPLNARRFVHERARMARRDLVNHHTALIFSDVFPNIGLESNLLVTVAMFLRTSRVPRKLLY